MVFQVRKLVRKFEIRYGWKSRSLEDVELNLNSTANKSRQMSRYKTTAEEFLDPLSDWDITAAETRWNTRLRAKIMDVPACMVCSMEIESEEELKERDVQSI